MKYTTVITFTALFASAFAKTSKSDATCDIKSLEKCVSSLAPTVEACAKAAEAGVSNLIDDITCIMDAAPDVFDPPVACDACMNGLMSAIESAIGSIF